MKFILAIILSMSMITSCKRNDTVSLQYDNSAHTLMNIPYGSDTSQRMDIYLPAGRSKDSTKSIILIHGGGWNGGNKSDFTSYIDSFKVRMPHYAVFNLNYRLVNTGQLFPAQENDIRSALDFITRNAAGYRIDTSRMVILGASAGAHLALLQSYKYQHPQIKAVIDFFGPSDLTAMYSHPWHPLVTYALQMVTGTTLAANPSIYRQSSPAHFISKNSPPTLIFHGGKDMIVNISQSRELQRKLEEVNIPNELVVYPGEQHGWSGKNLHDSFDRIQKFLETHVP